MTRSSFAAARYLNSRIASLSSPGARAAWCMVFALAIGIGASLRWSQLRIQVLTDDEWHAIHKLLSSDPKGIFTSFGLADHSIPLTLYYQFLMHHGGLTEWVMRVPFLIAGVSLVFVAPLLLRRQLSLPVQAAWAMLLAISPLLVYLSKTARPYALTCLLCFMAVIAFRRWWLRERNPNSWAGCYVLTTFLAGWLHLITLPFTLLPFAYYALQATAKPILDVWSDLRRLALFGLVTATPLLAVLLPPFINDWAQLAEKAGTHSVTIESAYRTLLMLFGISAPALLAIAIALTTAGVYTLRRRDGDFVRYVLFISGGTTAAVVLAHPAWIHHPGVLARYMLPALPFLLLFLAEGLILVVQRLQPPALGAAAVPVLALLLWLAGPIPAYSYRPNQFIGHLRFQFDYDDAHNPYVLQIPREPIPMFYRDLAQKPPGSLTLIEAPWRLESNFNPYPWYQEIHRQYVKIGLVTPVCGVRNFGEYPATVKGLRLRNMVHLSEILAGKTYGADYLIMHLRPWKTPPDAEVEWPDVGACIPKVIAAIGAPIYRDDGIVVFDLKRNRTADTGVGMALRSSADADAARRLP